MITATKRFEIGKAYQVTRIAKSTVEKFTATIDSIEDHGDHWSITYTPKPDKHGHRRCTWGVCKVKKVGSYNSLNYEFEEL